jgi:hypothetical protein
MNEKLKEAKRKSNGKSAPPQYYAGVRPFIFKVKNRINQVNGTVEARFTSS